MFCQKCGKELPEGAKFCNYCGEVQKEVSSGNANPPVNNQPQTNQVLYKEPKKSKGKAWKIVAVAAIILSLIGAISQKKLQEKDASDLPTPEETVVENPEFTKIFEDYIFASSGIWRDTRFSTDVYPCTNVACFIG